MKAASFESTLVTAAVAAASAGSGSRGASWAMRTGSHATTAEDRRAASPGRGIGAYRGVERGGAGSAPRSGRLDQVDPAIEIADDELATADLAEGADEQA